MSFDLNSVIDEARAGSSPSNNGTGYGVIPDIPEYEPEPIVYTPQVVPNTIEPVVPTIDVWMPPPPCRR